MGVRSFSYALDVCATQSPQTASWGRLSLIMSNRTATWEEAGDSSTVSCAQPLLACVCQLSRLAWHERTGQSCPRLEWG